MSDLYAMGVTEVDNMLMLLAVSTKMTEKERDVVIPLIMRGFKVINLLAYLILQLWCCTYEWHLCSLWCVSKNTKNKVLHPHHKFRRYSCSFLFALMICIEQQLTQDLLEHFIEQAGIEKLYLIYNLNIKWFFCYVFTVLFELHAMKIQVMICEGRLNSF